MAEYYSIVYMCYTFFIHSSVDGHLGDFHVLVIVNSAAMNIVVRMSFLIKISLSVCSGMRLRDYMVTLFLVFFFFLCTVDKSFIRLQNVVSWKLR